MDEDAKQFTAPNGLRIELDREEDVLYVHLRKPGSRAFMTEVVHDTCTADFNEAGTLLGVEFVDASKGIDLADVPEAERIREALLALPELPQPR